MGSIQTSERIEGADDPAVITTKTLTESRHSQRSLEEADHILIVGGGQVGLEAADAYITRGKKVTIVKSFNELAFKSFDSDLSPHVMERKLGYGGPVSDATTIGLRFILFHPLVERLVTQLTQLVT